MAVFGNTTPSGTISEIFGDEKDVTELILGEPGLAQKVTAYIDGLGPGVGNQAVKMVIYADSAGNPGALVAISNAVTIIDGQAAGWVDFPLPAPVLLAPGTYWVGYHGGPVERTARWYFAAGSGKLRWAADTYADGPANPFGSAGVANEASKVYVTYDPLSSGGGHASPSMGSRLGV